MIGKLTGTIDSVGEDFAILDVHGVGYLVHCSARTLQELPAVGEAVALAIETHVREDQIRLFGFLHEHEPGRGVRSLGQTQIVDEGPSGQEAPFVPRARCRIQGSM